MDKNQLKVIDSESIEAQMAVFKVGTERYAVDIMRIKEVIKPPKITPLPNVPDFLDGVINLRGMVMPVISMRERLGFPLENIGKEARVIIIILNGRAVGVFVDSVEEIVNIPLKDIKAPPKIAKGIDSEYLKGICRVEGDLLVLLDLDKILTTTERVMMEDLAKE